MEQQEEVLLKQQTLDILTLFPKRQITTLIPSLSLYTNLFQNLICTICKQILSNPIYFKCLHRFCQECINKCFRLNIKKICPNCKLQINNKKDIKYDHDLQLLIKFTFGDSKKLYKQIQQIDKIHNKSQKISQLKKIQSMIDIKNKNKQDQDYIASNTSIRRTKTVDGQQIKRKKREPSQKRIKNQDIQKQSTPSRKVKNISQKNIKKQQINISEKKKKKNQVMIIQIQSSDPVEVQQIPPQQFFHGQDNQNNENKINNLLCSISIIPQVSQIQSMKKIASYKEIDKDIGKSQKMIDQVVQQQKTQQKMIQQYIISDEVRQGRQKLRQQFGFNFISKIIEITDYQIYMSIKLMRHPNQPFTPILNFDYIKILCRSFIYSINIIISQQLNINKQAIRLYIDENNSNNYIQINSYMKIIDINDRYWRSLYGFQMIDLQDGQQKILGNIIKNKDNNIYNRIIYYSINYSKISI